MSKSIKAGQKPSHDEIAAYARSIYEQEGRPEGRSVEHWLQAEAQLMAERQAQSVEGPTKASAKSAPAVPQGKGKGNKAGWTAPAPSVEQSRANPN